MYQILILICGVFLSSTIVLADDTSETCANGAGKVVYGVVDNEKYCVGTGNLNWWNTYAWCDAQGMTLPDITQDCRCSEVTSDCSAGYCPNFGSRFTEGYMWFANTGDDGKAYHAQISSAIGWPRFGLKEKSNTYRMVAICKM